MSKLIVISGAGLSVESGIRAFRTDTTSGKAMWDEYSVDEVCEIGAFQRGYRAFKGEDTFDCRDEHGIDLYTKTHDFYNKRREELANVKPNSAHLAIAKLAKMYPGRVRNITTNVDDLLERAGVTNDIVHVHGKLTELIINRNRVIQDIGYSSVDVSQYNWCKPNVVFFGESAPMYREMYSLFDKIAYNDTIIVVGCSNQVINFNWELFPMLNVGAKMIVVNPDINYIEQQGYEERGVVVYRSGAVEAFSNSNLIDFIEKRMEK